MRSTLHVTLTLLVFILVTACGGESIPATVTPVPATLTPDPCSEANLPVEVGKVNKWMREFDDYSALASNTPQSQLVTVIPEMQRVLRETEDQAVPACLADLKKLQTDHMKTVVQTLLAFISSSDSKVVNAGITKARELHAQYDIEMARLLGVTLTVITPVVPTQPAQPTPTATPTPLVTNPGPNELNLRNAPDFNAPATTVLTVGGSTIALGRTADNQWIQVQVPGQPDQSAWVYATVIELSTSIEVLPIVTP
jgi:hypothetical protein